MTSSKNRECKELSHSNADRCNESALGNNLRKFGGIFPTYAQSSWSSWSKLLPQAGSLSSPYLASLARGGNTGAKCWLFCGLLHLAMAGVTLGSQTLFLMEIAALPQLTLFLLSPACNHLYFYSQRLSHWSLLIQKAHTCSPGYGFTAISIIKILCVYFVLLWWHGEHSHNRLPALLISWGSQESGFPRRLLELSSQKLISNFQGARGEVTTALPLFYWVSLNSQFKWAKATFKNSDIALFTEVVVPQQVFELLAVTAFPCMWRGVKDVSLFILWLLGISEPLPRLSCCNLGTQSGQHTLAMVPARMCICVCMLLFWGPAEGYWSRTEPGSLCTEEQSTWPVLFPPKWIFPSFQRRAASIQSTVCCAPRMNQVNL